jgi:sn-glycerol 3-phosphate transport system permease protein
MIERRPGLNLLSHLVLVLGVVIVAFPLYLTLIASTQSAEQIAQSTPMSLMPGGHMIETYKTALFGGTTSAGSKIPAAAPMMWVSLISALVIAVGVCHRVFPLSISQSDVLDDFCHPDAACGSAHWPYL